MASARSLPIASAEGSLTVRSVAGAPAGAGEGVAGSFIAAVDGADTGAGGAAGVWIGACAGVAGAALLEEPAGAALGFWELVDFGAKNLGSKCVMFHCFDARSIKLTANSDGAEKNGEWSVSMVMTYLQGSRVCIERCLASGKPLSCLHSM